MCFPRSEGGGFFYVGLDVRLMYRRPTRPACAWCGLMWRLMCLYVGAQRLMCAPGYLQEVG
jgi:hypothetical protein